MICTNTAQMIRVAHAGAAKMEKQGYTYTPTEGVPGWYTVFVPVELTADGKGKRYHVALLDATGQDCDCPFHKNNRHLRGTTCKHAAFVRWQEATTSEYEAMEEARAEEAEYQQFNQSRAEWLTFTPCHAPQAVAA